MVIYIYLLWHQIVIYCAETAGCMQVSQAHLNALLGMGALEMVLEIPQIIQIFFKKKEDKDVENSSSES